MSLKWTMRDGTKIAVSEMPDDHLVNAANMCLRQLENADSSEQKRLRARLWLRRFLKEMSRRAANTVPDDFVDDNDLIVNGCDRYGSLSV